MKNFTTILKAMFAVFFILQIIFYTQLYAGNNHSQNSVVGEGYVVLPDSESGPENNQKFRIGGISKVFTSAILLQMVDEKRIQLGTSIVRFFPDIPNAKHISIEDLMTGRINIIHYLEGGKYYEPILSKYVFDELAGEEFEVSGNVEDFSNPNFLVLGMIIEKLSGLSYTEELNNRIVQKLSLSNTFDGISQSTEMNEGSELLSKWDLGSVRGSGSIISTISDILQFKNALFNNQVVSENGLANLIRICAQSGFDLRNLGRVVQS